MAEENGSEKPVQVFTSADRIRQLNEIDKVRPTRNCGLEYPDAHSNADSRVYYQLLIDFIGCSQINTLCWPCDPGTHKREIQ